MKKLNIRLPHHLFTLTFTLTLGSALAAPVELHISQALATGTAITAYITVRDGAGAPIIGNPAAQFHATLGTQTVEIATVTPFNATNEGVLSLLLVDVSRSLDTAQFARIKQALRDWINALGEHDQAALLTFGDQVQTQVLPTADRTALLAAIETLAATDAHTALHQALAQGLALGRQQGAELPSRRALVILSDGLDDARVG
jgi:Mg-chelatase subunit ChlD